MILERPLQTQRLRLRSLTEGDATERYAAWLNDPSVNQYLESRFRKHTVTGVADFIRGCNADPSVLLLGIYLADGGSHIGNIKIGPIDRNHGLGEVGLMIGDQAAWGKGYAREAIGAVTQHAFMSLGLFKLSAGCYAPNIGSQRAFEACNYRVEAVRPRHYRCGEDRVSLVMMGRCRENA